jgi:uncharacterized protein (UPF0216 family)
MTMPLKETGSLEKWISLEFRKLNASLVRRQPTLFELLEMEHPKAETHDGEEYTFDKKTLKELSQALPEKFHGKLKLPIFFFNDTRVPDSCYIIDDIAAEALTAIGELNPLYRFRKKKLWIGKPIAYEIGNKYPTLTQFVLH